MLKIDRAKRTFERLTEESATGVAIRERSDLQQMIKATPEPFFAELGEKLLLVGEELRPVDFVDDRVDLLALDETGAAVVIELKRGGHKLHLLQAIAYAGMVAKWDAERFVAERAKFTGRTLDAVTEECEEFIGDLTSVNHAQRIVLLAESFDYEVLVAAEWLNERFDVDVRCARLSLSRDGDTYFLTCSVIFPPAEITEHAERRRRVPPPASPWKNWSEALEETDNTAMVEFFKRQLANGVHNNVPRRFITVPVSGRGWFRVVARRKRAYVWQVGRFQDDLAFWKDRLSPEAEPIEVEKGERLRFYLTLESDFRRFEEACITELPDAVMAGLHSEDDLEAGAL